jgi:hypothetical protein
MALDMNSQTYLGSGNEPELVHQPDHRRNGYATARPKKKKKKKKKSAILAHQKEYLVSRCSMLLKSSLPSWSWRRLECIGM